MIFEHEIYHKENLNFEGTSVCRKAVRAVIIKEKLLFMVYLNKTNEYKFPGGGVNENETYEEALTREVIEETGAKVKRIGNIIGVITEYNKQENDDVDYFKMISTYYDVEIEDYFNEQRLDEYEKELGFKPKWISINEAESVNNKMMNSKIGTLTKGIIREAYALKEINKYYHKIDVLKSGV